MLEERGFNDAVSGKVFESKCKLSSISSSPNASKRMIATRSWSRCCADLNRRLGLDDSGSLPAEARVGTREKRLPGLAVVNTDILVVGGVQHHWKINHMLVGRSRELGTRTRVTLGQARHTRKDAIAGVCMLECFEASRLFFGEDSCHATSIVTCAAGGACALMTARGASSFDVAAVLGRSMTKDVRPIVSRPSYQQSSVFSDCRRTLLMRFRRQSR